MTQRPEPPSPGFLRCPDTTAAEIRDARNRYFRELEAYVDKAERRAEYLLKEHWAALAHIIELREQVQEAQAEAELALENGRFQGEQMVLQEVVRRWPPGVIPVYEWSEGLPRFNPPHRRNYQAMRDSYKPGTQVWIADIPEGEQAATQNIPGFNHEFDVVCGVAFQLPGNEYAMRKDFQAAEAFATLLNALPFLAELYEDLEGRAVDRHTLHKSPALPPAPPTALEAPDGDETNS